MSIYAAVMTGPGAGAIATIQLVGNSAATVLREIFRRPDGKPLDCATGRIFLGDIIEGQQIVDQVTLGCEGPGVFAIHCHGNPLIVERIMGLLQRHGVQPVRPEQMLSRMLTSREPADSIAAEAKLALATVKIVEGASLIANQVKGGLAARIRRWQAELDSTPLEQITAEAKRILRDSETARLILSGCTIALVGPPNTGKSTLLNALAGREKAIVTDIPGTTRDWVSAEIRIPPLAATIIDTAGLDATLASTGEIDQTAQRKTIEALNRADLVLLVLDASQPAEQLRIWEGVRHRGHREHRVDTDSVRSTNLTPFSVSSVPSVANDSQVRALSLVEKRTLVVLNKADLPPRLDSNSLPTHLRHAVHISAKLETGIEDLIRAIHGVCGLASFPLNTTVAFTDRQRSLIERLTAASSYNGVSASIADLLHGLIT